MNLYGLIGYPLSHSFSKQYFTEKFARAGISNSAYRLFPLESIDNLPLLLQSLPELVGFNVTIPYKEQVLEYLDEIDPAAAQIGAVNTVKVNNGKLKGYNTDVYGFEQSLTDFLRKGKGFSYVKNALILGTGGASKAVAFILNKSKINYRYVSRRSGRGYLTYDSIDTADLTDYQLIINTTPLGMSPRTDSCPDLPYRGLTDEHYLYDLVYNPEETLFLQKGKERGARTKNGLEMLYLQAEKAWEIWTGPE